MDGEVHKHSIARLKLRIPDRLGTSLSECYMFVKKIILKISNLKLNKFHYKSEINIKCFSTKATSFSIKSNLYLPTVIYFKKYSIGILPRIYSLRFGDVFL